MLTNLIYVTCLLAGAQLVLSYKTGAPKEVCQTMTPEHGVPPQPLPSPYTLKLDKNKARASGKITVTLSSPQKESFKGFMLQGRDSTTNETCGTFESHPNAKSLECTPGVKDTVTHKSDAAKSSITVIWVAPKSNGKKICEIWATTARNGNEFWVGQKSGPITVG